MPSRPAITTLCIAGVHVASEGYPNVTWRIATLRARTDIEVREVVFPFARDQSSIWSSASKLRVAKLTTALLAHARVVRGLLGRTDQHVYVPYPAIGVLLLLSFLPRGLRPRSLHADCFISLYDTAVNDRALFASATLRARLLYWAERRAMSICDSIVVDTPENASHLSRLFGGIDASKFIDIPLASAPCRAPTTSSEPNAREPFTHVVFVGTFVPLQGVDIIARAIVALAEREDLRFTIVGTGQTADTVAEILGPSRPRVTWITAWQSHDALCEIIAGADICLGIFGGTDKTDRVWPLKNYLYMAMGKAIITADTRVARRLLDQHPDAFSTVPPSDHQALAEAVIALARDGALRDRLASNARRMYERAFTNEESTERLLARIRDTASRE